MHETLRIKNVKLLFYVVRDFSQKRVGGTVNREEKHEKSHNGNSCCPVWL